MGSKPVLPSSPSPPAVASSARVTEGLEPSERAIASSSRSVDSAAQSACSQQGTKARFYVLDVGGEQIVAEAGVAPADQFAVHAPLLEETLRGARFER